MIWFESSSPVTDIQGDKPFLCSHLKAGRTWWRHQMESFSAWLAICAGNSPVHGEFPAQRPVTRSFDVVFDLRLNKRLSQQSWGWWFETLSRPLWRHCFVMAWHCPSGSPSSPLTMRTLTQFFLIRIVSFLDTRYIRTFRGRHWKPASQFIKYAHNDLYSHFEHSRGDCSR